MLDDLAVELHANSVNKGFYEGVDITQFREQASKLCLVHSEVTETMEALRKEKGEAAVLDEMADVLIRLLDLYEALRETGVVTGSLDEALANKAYANTKRPHMHGVLG